MSLPVRVESPLSVVRASGPEQVAACLVIRRTVFVEEQGVPVEVEVDEFDTEATHYLALVSDEPVGTARLRLLPPFAKVQRVAVLPVFRGLGIGGALMRALTDELREAPGEVRTLTLGSQQSAVPFYESLGYRPHGEPFMDAGIPHIEMRLPV